MPLCGACDDHLGQDLWLELSQTDAVQEELRVHALQMHQVCIYGLRGTVMITV